MSPGAAVAVAVVTALALAGCADTPELRREAAPTTPRLGESAWTTHDGTRLPVTRWRPEREPRGVVLALHGFAEHRDMFYALAPHLAAAGYTVVAYDQRGFGESPSRGHWPGRAQLVDDARAAYRLLARAHRGRPVYLLGHSMGAAVAALAVTGEGAVNPAGTILLAPAVHGWDTLPWIQRVSLRLSAWIAPGARPRQSWGRALVDVQVTDDPRIRRVQAGDPRVLHAIRLDMIRGLVDLMDTALERVPAVPASTLILYGARDDIIPAAAACAMLDRLARRPPPRPRFALYPEGYHYLGRDLQRGRTIGDVLAWMDDRTRALPSGAEAAPAPARATLCGEPPGPDRAQTVVQPRRAR